MIEDPLQCRGVVSRKNLTLGLADHLVQLPRCGAAADEDGVKGDVEAGQFLAARLGWPQATFASKIEFVGSQIRVARETDAGIETILVSQPAVITTDLRLNEPRYTSLPSILKARHKTIERILASELGVIIEPRIELVKMETVSSERSCQMLDNLDQLVTQILEHAGGPASDAP